MGINLLAPKGSRENMKLTSKIHEKLNEVRKKKDSKKKTPKKSINR